MGDRVQVSEEKIVEAIVLYRKAYSHDPVALMEVLETGALFKEEGLHPFYIMDGSTVHVTSEEAMSGKLN